VKYSVGKQYADEVAQFFGWHGASIAGPDPRPDPRLSSISTGLLARRNDEMAFQSGYNDVSDAMRHAFWNTYFAQVGVLMKRTITALLITLIVLATASCGKKDSVIIGPDSILDDALSVIATSTHEEVALADLTTWGWDELFVFVEGTPATEIEAAAGQPIIKDKYLYERRLMLFMEGGKPVRAVPTNMAFSNSPEQSHFTSAVRVVSREGQSGGWFIWLAEPGDTP